MTALLLFSVIVLEHSFELSLTGDSVISWSLIPEANPSQRRDFVLFFSRTVSRDVLFFLLRSVYPFGSTDAKQRQKAFGQLVLLGFAIADFTPAAYQRCRLQRPYMEILSWGWLRA